MQKRALTELEIIFMFTQLECEELRDFDLSLVNFENNNVVHVLIAIAINIKQKKIKQKEEKPDSKVEKPEKTSPKNKLELIKLYLRDQGF